MGDLQIAGVIGTVNAKLLAHKSYVTDLLASDLTEAQVDARIAADLASYADKSYVDSHDALLANQAYVDAGDATRLKLASKDVANGVAGLRNDGRVDPNRINATVDQRRPAGPWTPSSYGTYHTVNATETTIYTVPITDPGYSYKVIAMGQVDAFSSLDGAAPLINCRVGNETTGAIVASGRGSAESYTAGSGGGGSYTTPGSYSHDISAISTFDIVGIGAGGAGFSGTWGGKGTWGGLTVTKGVNISSGATSLSIVVGAPNSLNATASTIAGTSLTGTPTSQGPGSASVSSGTLTCPRGNVGGGGSQAGTAVADFTFNGHTYTGCAQAASANSVGNNPGGGGGSNSQLGGNGAVFISAGGGAPVDDPDNNYAPVSVVPILGTQTARTGSTNLYVRVVRAGTSANVTAGYNDADHVASLTVFTIPA